MENRKKKEICKKCSKEFYVIETTYPSNLEDKRESYVNCPYCGRVLWTVNLRGNQDISVEKI